MKVGIANTKDWNMSECMSAARYVEYKSEDFKHIDMISTGYAAVESHNDVRKMCRNLTTCTVQKCNLKAAVIENKMTIMANIYKRKLDEMKIMIESAEGQLQKIRKSTEEKLEKIEKQTGVQ
jgi:hypothetical protein